MKEREKKDRGKREGETGREERGRERERGQKEGKRGNGESISYSFVR